MGIPEGWSPRGEMPWWVHWEDRRQVDDLVLENDATMGRILTGFRRVGRWRMYYGDARAAFEDLRLDVESRHLKMARNPHYHDLDYKLFLSGFSDGGLIRRESYTLDVGDVVHRVEVREIRYRCFERESCFALFVLVSAEETYALNLEDYETFIRSMVGSPANM
jgi:hypothetical protein